MSAVDSEFRLQQLLARAQSDPGVDDDLDDLGALIDLASDLGNAGGLDAAIAWYARLKDSTLRPDERALLHYFAANAHSARGALRGRTVADDAWDDSDLEDELLNLRLARALGHVAAVPDVRQLQIITNLGNALRRCGRFVDAIEYYDQAIELGPGFGMAHLNRGLSVKAIADVLGDDQTRSVLAREAHNALATAKGLQLEGNGPDAVQRALADMERRVSPEFFTKPSPQSSVLTNSPAAEAQYRRWCLKRRLFLNELNDISELPFVGRDSVLLPPIVVPLEEGPGLLGLFNQLKMEFVHARWLLYEGLTASSPHMAERDVSLADTLDYPNYSLSAERVRTSFRLAYSLFDKVAFFLNRYLEIGLRDSQVSFRRLWYDEPLKDRRIRDSLRGRGSWPLRGLFWMGKDFFEEDPAFREALLPEAQELASLRHHLEHRYLKLQGGGDAGKLPDGLRDDLALSQESGRFELKTLALLRRCHAALLHLGWTVKVEEHHRASSRPPGTIVPAAVLPVIDAGDPA